MLHTTDKCLDICSKPNRHALMDFELIGNIEPIAIGRGIRIVSRLKKQYGQGNWKKLKGIATVRLMDGTVHTAEIH